MSSQIVNGRVYAFINWANLQALDLSEGPQIATNGNPVCDWAIHSDNSFTNQLWRAQQNADGTFTLYNVKGGTVLDMDTGKRILQGWQNLGGFNQAWSFENASQSGETPSFFIKGKTTGQYVTIPGGNPQEGTHLVGRNLNEGQQANWSRWVAIQYNI